MRHHSRFMRLIAVCAMLGSFFTFMLAATPVGAASPLSVVFDSDSYQGVPLYAFALETGNQSGEITVNFRNTSPTNTLFRQNVFLAFYNPDTGRGASPPFCAVEPQGGNCYFVPMDGDCPPGTLCSFHYSLDLHYIDYQRPNLASTPNGYYRVDLRMMVLNPDDSFGGWLNTPDGSPTYEEYFINVV